MPTAPSSRDASSRCVLVGVATGARSPTHRDPRAPACSASRARPAGPGTSASSVAIVTPAAIESTSVVAAQRRLRRLQARRDVAGLHRDDHDVGVGDRPRRARHDADLRELLLELAAAVGVDLGDRELVGVPAAVEQAAEQRGTHLPAADQGHARHPTRVTPRRCARRAANESAKRVGPEEPSEPPRTSPNGTAPPAPRARQLRPSCDGKATVALPLERITRPSDTSSHIVR